jgi:hypothetical protein
MILDPFRSLPGICGFIKRLEPVFNDGRKERVMAGGSKSLFL